MRLNLTSRERRPPGGGRDHRQCAARRKPEARIAGVTIHPMIVRPKARELIVGIADDPTFGPVIVFGRGGTAVEVIDDKALALPPLDLNLARDLIAPHAGLAHPQGLSRRSGREGRRCRARPGQARAARRGSAGSARARHQSAARRRERRAVSRRAGGGRARSRKPPRDADIRASPSGPTRANGSAGSCWATGGAFSCARSDPRTKTSCTHSSRRSRRTTCGCASSRRSGISATPSSRASPSSIMRRAMAFVAIDEATGEMIGVVRLHMPTPITRSANTRSCCARISRGAGSAGS